MRTALACIVLLGIFAWLLGWWSPTVIVVHNHGTADTLTFECPQSTSTPERTD